MANPGAIRPSGVSHVSDDPTDYAGRAGDYSAFPPQHGGGDLVAAFGAAGHLLPAKVVAAIVTKITALVYNIQRSSDGASRRVVSGSPTQSILTRWDHCT